MFGRALVLNSFNLFACPMTAGTEISPRPPDSLRSHSVECFAVLQIGHSPQGYYHSLLLCIEGAGFSRGLATILSACMLFYSM